MLIQSVSCTKLQSKYEHLYASYHVAITVNSNIFHKAIELFSAADAWPVGVFLKRFFKPKAIKTNDG